MAEQTPTADAGTRAPVVPYLAAYGVTMLGDRFAEIAHCPSRCCCPPAVRWRPVRSRPPSRRPPGARALPRRPDRPGVTAAAAHDRAECAVLPRRGEAVALRLVEPLRLVLTNRLRVGLQLGLMALSAHGAALVLALLGSAATSWVSRVGAASALADNLARIRGAAGVGVLLSAYGGRVGIAADAAVLGVVGLGLLRSARGISEPTGR